MLSASVGEKRPRCPRGELSVDDALEFWKQGAENPENDPKWRSLCEFLVSAIESLSEELHAYQRLLRTLENSSVQRRNLTVWVRALVWRLEIELQYATQGLTEGDEWLREDYPELPGERAELRRELRIFDSTLGLQSVDFERYRKAAVGAGPRFWESCGLSSEQADELIHHLKQKKTGRPRVPMYEAKLLLLDQHERGASYRTLADRFCNCGQPHKARRVKAGELHGVKGEIVEVRNPCVEALRKNLSAMKRRVDHYRKRPVSRGIN